MNITSYTYYQPLSKLDAFTYIFKKGENKKSNLYLISSLTQNISDFDRTILTFKNLNLKKMKIIRKIYR